MYDIMLADLGGHGQHMEAVQARYPFAKITRYFDSVLATALRCAERSRTSHFWLVLSCADVSNFDFDWQPVPWEQHQIHCWAQPNSKFGDVMLIPAQHLLTQNPQLLEWYTDVNYHTQVVSRHAWPIRNYSGQDLTQSILTWHFASEYCVFTNSTLPSSIPEPALWGKDHHQLISFSQDNGMNMVPRQAKDCLEKQVYDYHNLVRTNWVQGQTQDIVFISYDEPQADQNYQLLVKRFPQAKRVHGVDGMEHALRAAAQLSSTPWFFAVFAKTRLHENWDFGFTPDRWQAPKHYIFQAENASNGLCYGHMGIILYHTQTVLHAPEWDEISGLDYTMSFATESIPLVSVYGEFATDPYRAWRTAFRETAKLTQWYLENGCVETAYRIHTWCNHAQGQHAEWVLRGANDGVNYYQDHADNQDALKKMFRWEWLSEHFQELYAPDPR
jgi:hypothetical protein